MGRNDFQRHQEALARQLGGRQLGSETATDLDTMQRASGIDDHELLADLVQLGIRPDSLLLMSLAPLVAVAWVDGEVQPGEREAILRVAAQRGIVPGTAPFGLLEEWLLVAPGEQLLETWEAFVKAVIAKWPNDKAERFQKQVGSLARMVAGASGGLLGIGATSAAEASLIGRIEGAFDLGWR